MVTVREFARGLFRLVRALEGKTPHGYYQGPRWGRSFAGRR
jgi:hypothetical protein